MRLTPHGIKEILLASLLLLSAAAALILFVDIIWVKCLAVVPIGLWLFVLYFFRDPERTPREAKGTIISPADGKVTDITYVEEVEYLHCEALRVGIFMNVFSVHVNRSPVTGTVEYVKHHPGSFKDVRFPSAIANNEHVTIGIACDDPIKSKIVVRQVAGLVARRIVCDLSPGDKVIKGRRFGMIKFGSRLEVFVPKDVSMLQIVKLGDNVFAGKDTILAAKAKS